MKYEGVKTNPAAPQEQAAADIVIPPVLPEAVTEQADMDSADLFQARLYQSGQLLLSKLERQSGKEKKEQELREELDQRLRQLKDFRFNIAFAGGMSSGKSSVINALIDYPLMPTCKLTTTCVGTTLFYGEKPRIRVYDDDKRKQIFDMDCTKVSEKQFKKLKEYACTSNRLKIVENLQYFTDCDLSDRLEPLTPDMLEMDRNDPNQIIVLMMILLTVYVEQNDKKLNKDQQWVNQSREETLKFFGIEKLMNYHVQIQWDGAFLKSGMVITDLPGLGAYAPDKDVGNGAKLKGHDSISMEAIKQADAMAFLVDPQCDGSGVPALNAMISNAQLKETISKDDLIIPVLNKVDGLKIMQIQQAVEKFRSILSNNGVEKEDEEIQRCASWFGEYNFTAFPIQRTAIYFREGDEIRSYYEDEYEGEELEQFVREQARKKLKKGYEKSGIAALKEFFRSAYVKKSKNRRAQTAVLAMRKLALEMITPRELRLKNYEALGEVAIQAIKDISEQLRSRIDIPIEQALKEISKFKHEKKYVDATLESIPALYQNLFLEALDEYQMINLSILDRFEIAFAGMGDSARINVAGSHNDKVYDELKESIGQFPMNVTKVNKQYSAALECVSQENDAMYRMALQTLRKLKKEIPKILDDQIKWYTKHSGEGDSTVKVVRSLRDLLVDYMSQKIDGIEDSICNNRQNMDAVGNEIVNRIMECNEEIMGLFTASVSGDVQNCLARGILFSKREYIDINSSNGLRNKLLMLKISKEDREHIEAEITAIGIESVKNNLNHWYQTTENDINRNFSSLHEELKTLLNDAVKELESGAVDLAEKAKELRRQLKEIRSALRDVRDEVQECYRASLENSGDALLSKYKDNIFSGILDRDGGKADGAAGV